MTYRVSEYRVFEGERRSVGEEGFHEEENDVPDRAQALRTSIAARWMWNTEVDDPAVKSSQKRSEPPSVPVRHPHAPVSKTDLKDLYRPMG